MYTPYEKQPPAKWYGWVILALIIAGIIWSQTPDKPMTPRQEQQMNRRLRTQAEAACADVSDRLQDACIASELEKYDAAADEKARELNRQ